MAVPPWSLQQEPSWECAWCGHVLPALNKISLRASCKAHWKSCKGKPKGPTLGKNLRRLLEQKSIRINGRNKGSLGGATRFASVSDRIKQYNATKPSSLDTHDLLAVYHGKEQSKYMVTCRRCTIYWLSITDLFQEKKHVQCYGQLKRQQLFNSSGRRTTWKHDETCHFVSQTAALQSVENHKAGAQRPELYWQEQAAGSSQHFLAKRLDCRWR